MSPFQLKILYIYQVPDFSKQKIAAKGNKMRFLATRYIDSENPEMDAWYNFAQIC